MVDRQTAFALVPGHDARPNFFAQGFLRVCDRCHHTLAKTRRSRRSGPLPHQARMRPKEASAQPTERIDATATIRGNHNPGPIAIDEFLRPIEATGWPGLDRVMIFRKRRISAGQGHSPSRSGELRSFSSAFITIQSRLAAHQLAETFRVDLRCRGDVSRASSQRADARSAWEGLLFANDAVEFSS